MELSLGMFMTLMFIVGLILTIFAFRIAPDVSNCSSLVQKSARGLLIMGIIIVSVSATYSVCGCSKGFGNMSKDSIGTGFVVLMASLGIVTIVLTSIVHNGCEDARKSTPFLITMSVFTIAISGFVLGYSGYHSITKNKSSFGVDDIFSPYIDMNSPEIDMYSP